MKLIYGIPSPYSRKARIAILEKGLGDHIRFIAHNPFEEPEAVRAANPIGKVPALILEDGTTLFDSPVICEYVDCLSTDTLLFPASGKERWRVLRWQALADGILDATYNISCEYRRDESRRSLTWIDLWASSISRGLDVLENEINSFPDHITIAHIAVACVPDYIELRAADHVNWRDKRPSLAKWFDTFSDRESMIGTRPAG